MLLGSIMLYDSPDVTGIRLSWYVIVPTVGTTAGLVFFAVSLLLGNGVTDGFVFAVGVTVALVPEALLPTVTLSLAGIAGFILSLGMAVDANILIFARVKEELALGKNGRLYVELGLGMTRAIMAAPESMEHGLGYTDLAKIDEQAKVEIEVTAFVPG